MVDKGVARKDNTSPFGGVPEWPKGSDCKSDAQASVVRIHPPPPLMYCAGFLDCAEWKVGKGGSRPDDLGGVLRIGMPSSRSM